MFRGMHGRRSILVNFGKVGNEYFRFRPRVFQLGSAFFSNDAFLRIVRLSTFNKCHGLVPVLSNSFRPLLYGMVMELSILGCA